MTTIIRRRKHFKETINTLDEIDKKLNEIKKMIKRSSEAI